MNRIFLAACILSVALLGTADAQSDRKKQTVPGVTAPKGNVVAPLKSAPKTNTTKAPIGTTLAPLTSGECKGLGGTVKTNFTCKSGSGCYTVDPHGVIRMACINK